MYEIDCIMRIIRKILAAAAVCLSFAGLSAYAQGAMTDDEVLEYVQQGVAEGKSRDDMVSELTLRGVTREQARRVYNMYQSRSASHAAQASAGTRAHTTSADVVDESQVTAFVAENIKVYGRDIFRNKQLNFAPSENLATPRNYRLGPGDEVIIDVFGRNQTTLRSVISPEGSINVDILGPLYLNGMTIDEANAYLKKRLSQIYGGLESSGTDMRLSLGQIRTIQVSVVGDVLHAGTYVLSAFATAFHALYRAGGIVEPGTLRDIKVVRNDKVIAHMDVYDFLQRADRSSDVRLEEGDVILVAPYKSLVSVDGSVKRPMFFEMKEGQTLAELIEYAGGFTNGANTSMVTVYRQNQKAFEVHTVADRDFTSFVLLNGDRVEVGDLISRFENRIAIRGSVYFPGTYELGKDVHTARQLVEKAGGLLPEAFTDRVVVHREYPDKSKEVFSLNLTDILAGRRADFELQNNDEIFISDAFDLKEEGTMTITGMVNHPGTFPFAQNTTIEDLIIMAGGLQDGASTARVDVTRRKKDDSGLIALDEIGELYSFSLENGLADTGDRVFVLEPYDEVTVHRSPSYNVQRHFVIQGEVNFPGTYSLTSREERVSDLIRKAGGLTAFAYSQGTRLTRVVTGEERRQLADMQAIITAETDSDETVRGRFTGTYTVSIDLDKALAKPGSGVDVVLREGDVLTVPGRSNVVRIHGAVMYPTAVSYDPSMRGRDYIKVAGGYSKDASRGKTYVVNMGGRAKRLRCGTKVEPGAEIYVPEKKKKDNKVEPSLIVAIGSAASSLSTMALVIYNIFK